MSSLFRLSACWAALAAVIFAPLLRGEGYGIGFSGLEGGAEVPEGQEITVSLVADVKSVAPGQVFRVAVKLEHAPDWHSYWQNSGGISLPTTVAWELPPGFTAGPLRWPLPIRYVSQGFPAFINPDNALIVSEVTAPANLPPGGEIVIKAKVDGQVCKEACVIFEQSPELKLTSGAAVPDDQTKMEIESALAAAPRRLDGWTASAADAAGGGVILTLAPGPGASPVTEAYFFSLLPDIDGQGEQAVTFVDGKVVLNLKRPDDDTVKPGRRVQGVVYTKGGWLKDQPGSTGWQIDIEIGKDPAPATGAKGEPLSLYLLGLAFLGGLILNLMPCVFPVLGLKIMNFVNQAGEDHRKVVMHGLIFTLGVLVSFWILAGIIIAVKAATGGGDLIWGFQLQDPRFVLLMVVVLFVFSLNLAGLFEFGTSATSVGGGLARKSGLSGSFFSGVLATLVATPCAAPFLAPALGVALGMDTLPSLAMFTAMGIGLSAPYLLLSVVPKLVDYLPRPGAWMETFKKLMSFPMFATVAYLVWVLGQQVSEDAFLLTLIGLSVIAMGIFIYGKWGQPWQKSATKWKARVACLMLLGGSVAMAWPNPDAPTIKWEVWSPETVAKLREEKRPVFIDFTAAWCVTCKANKARYSHDEKVIALMEKKGVVALKADFTRKDPEIYKGFAVYGRRAVPVNVLYAPGATDPVIFPETFGAGEMLEKLGALPDWQKK